MLRDSGQLIAAQFDSMTKNGVSFNSTNFTYMAAEVINIAEKGQPKVMVPSLVVKTDLWIFLSAMRQKQQSKLQMPSKPFYRSNLGLEIRCR